MFVVVTYDVVDDRVRTRVAKIMEAFGRRVQKSVFECRLDDRNFLNMKRRVEKELDPEEDSVRYYFLCERCSGRVEVTGQGSVWEDEDLFIV